MKQCCPWVKVSLSSFISWLHCLDFPPGSTLLIHWSNTFIHQSVKATHTQHLQDIPHHRTATQIAYTWKREFFWNFPYLTVSKPISVKERHGYSHLNSETMWVLYSCLSKSIYRDEISWSRKLLLKYFKSSLDDNCTSLSYIMWFMLIRYVSFMFLAFQYYREKHKSGRWKAEG